MAVDHPVFAFLNALLFRVLRCTPGAVVRLWVSQGAACSLTLLRRMASARTNDVLRATIAGLQGSAGQLCSMEFSPRGRSPEPRRGSWNLPDYFEVLGRGDSSARYSMRTRSVGSSVAVISYSLWMGDFSGDPAVTERLLRVGEIDVQIVVFARVLR